MANSTEFKKTSWQGKNKCADFVLDLKNMENENEKDATVKAWMMDNGSPTSGDLDHQGLHFLHCEFLCSTLNLLHICLCQMPLASRPSVGILSSYSFAFKMITCWANGAHRHNLLFCPLLNETVWQFCLISGKFGAARMCTYVTRILSLHSWWIRALFTHKHLDFKSSDVKASHMSVILRNHSELLLATMLFRLAGNQKHRQHFHWISYQTGNNPSKSSK